MWNIDLGQDSVNFMSDTTVRVAIALLDFTASCLSHSSQQADSAKPPTGCPQAMDMDHMEVKSEQGLSPDAYVKEEEEDKKMEMKQEMATTEWTEGLIPEATDLDLQKNLVISALKQLLVKFGSARVYLEQRYKERAEAMLF